MLISDSTQGYFALVLLFIVLAKKEIVSFFDLTAPFQKVLKLPVNGLQICFQLCLLIAIVAGIRSAGVVLVSSLLIAPPCSSPLFLPHAFFLFVLLQLLQEEFLPF